MDTDGDGEPDTSYVTPVKFQNPFGSCWSFAAIAASETSLISSGIAAEEGYAAAANEETGEKELDLSEKHMAFYTFQPIDDIFSPQNGEGIVYKGEDGASDIYDIGGFAFYTTSMFAQGAGPVFESEN